MIALKNGTEGVIKALTAYPRPLVLHKIYEEGIMEMENIF